MEPFRDDGNGNRLPQHVDRYPSFLNDLFDPDRVGDINGDGDEFDEVGGVAENPGATPLMPYGDVEPLQPTARYSGSILVAGEAQLFQILVLAPGDLSAFAPPHPLADFGSADLGYPMVFVLNDPTQEPGPSSITDACTPSDTRVLLWGKTRDNPCTASPSPCSNDDTPCFISCGINLDISALPGLVDSGVGPCSGSNEAGCVRYANPSTAGTHHFYVYQQSQRDLDGDGVENGLDTCPYDTNVEDPRQASGPDGDMLDSACDPTPSSNTGSGNHDGDTIGSPARAWYNAGDNCPLVFNPGQEESESVTSWNEAAPRGGSRADQIGDACDSNPTRADGQFHTVFADIPKRIGATDADGDGWCAGDDPDDVKAKLTPEEYQYFVPLPLTHSGSGVNAGVGGTVSAGFGLQAKAGSTNTGAGQPYQLCNDGIDNDGDTLKDMLDSGCHPSGLSALDSDGDGYSDEAEIHIGTDPLGRCEVGGPSSPSTDWPSDLAGGGNSQDRVTLNDLTAFSFPEPSKLNTSPGDPGWDQRYDLVPNGMINLNDQTALLYGPTGYPPMYAGIGDGGAYNNIACTGHPTYGD